ncbi:hypothetical protein [Aequorivita iocasae]|uniref:Four helix bundle protein n=1 Tax=Aequorivita iocasae TaxID=2803865 RepID=A0ABX7DZJ2_9FLAO|nr:hypothetical protein JK629_04315 [Aequorivita iocasae]
MYAATELNFIENDLSKKVLAEISEIKKMLYALIQTIKKQL